MTPSWEISEATVYFTRVSKPISRRELHTLRTGQNRRHFADDIFKCIFFNENVSISIMISLNSVPKGSIDNDYPSIGSDNGSVPHKRQPVVLPLRVGLLTHLYITEPQWMKAKRLQEHTW